MSATDWKGLVAIRNLPGGDLHDWLIDAPLTFISERGVCITIQPGATTDGASIPRFFWRFIGGPFDGRYVAAALIHDQLYATHGVNGRFTREQCDKIFREAMLKSGVASWKAAVMYRAVRIGGGTPWKRHRQSDVVRQMTYLRVTPSPCN